MPYDIAGSLRGVDMLGALMRGAQAGQQMSTYRDQQQSRQALSRLMNGDALALADIPDPEMRMKADEWQRGQDIRQGLQSFYNPLDQQVVGVNNLQTLATGKPKGMDYQGALSYLASKGAFDQMEPIAKAMKIGAPESDEYLGSSLVDAQGNVYGVSKQKGWQRLGFTKNPDMPEAPKTRTFRRGSSEVTQEYTPNGWRDVAIGLAFKPDSVDGSGMPKPGSLIQLRVNAILNAANETAGGLELISQMPVTAGLSRFNDLQNKGGGVWKAFLNNTNRVLSTEDQILYNQATSGLANSLARLVSGGYSPNQALVEAIKEASTVKGDYTALNAQMAFLDMTTIAKKALKGMKMGTPEQQAEAASIKKWLEQFPDRTEFYKAVKKGQQAPTMNQSINSKAPVQSGVKFLGFE